MMTNEFEMPTRQVGESSPARKALLDYLAMGEHRSLSELAERYTVRRESDDRPPTSRLATLKCWSRKFNWQSIASEYDQHQEWMRMAEQCKQNRSEHREQLQRFRESHLQVGRAGFKASADALREILEFLDEHPKINSWSEANQAAGLIRQCQPISEWWSKALCIQRVLDASDIQPE